MLFGQMTNIGFVVIILPKKNTRERSEMALKMVPSNVRIEDGRIEVAHGYALPNADGTWTAHVPGNYADTLRVNCETRYDAFLYLMHVTSTAKFWTIEDVRDACYNHEISDEHAMKILYKLDDLRIHHETIGDALYYSCRDLAEDMGYALDVDE